MLKGLKAIDQLAPLVTAYRAADRVVWGAIFGLQPRGETPRVPLADEELWNSPFFKSYLGCAERFFAVEPAHED